MQLYHTILVAMIFDCSAIPTFQQQQGSFSRGIYGGFNSSSQVVVLGASRSFYELCFYWEILSGTWAVSFLMAVAAT